MKINKLCALAPLLIFYCCSVKADVNIIKTDCYRVNNSYFVDINANIYPSKDVIDALKSGITLYFSYDIRIAGGWFTPREMNFPRQLRYNSIAQTYTIIDAITRHENSYNSAAQTFTALGTTKALPIVAQLFSNINENKKIKVRLRLLQQYLPMALRFSSLYSKDWNLTSNWSTSICFSQN